jgi:dTDP-4-amino-4,6-dideoxygalactose transaminase
MHVPLLDLRAQYAPLKNSIQAAIAEVCDSQHFVLGPQVEDLEQRLATYVQAEHAIGVSSGTDALLLALMALEIGSGDEVITSPYSFFATAGVIARLNARPIFCDIDADTFNLSSVAVRQFIDQHCDLKDGGLVNKDSGGRIKALLPVHLYGQMADMDAMGAIAREFGLKLIEDAAQALGSALADGRRAGSLGDIACFSFFPTKNLGAFGDGGLCTTDDPELAERMRVLRVHGGKPKYYHALIGGNFRLDALQAAVLRIKLDHLDSWTAARQANAAHYRELIETAGLNRLITPPAECPGRHIYNQFVIRCPDRDKLRAFLAENEVGTEIYYPVSLHEQECFAYLGYAPADLPVSSQAAAESLALPIYPELAAEQREFVVGKIAQFYRRA